ncbi:small integral membrane protein 20 isoform X1 [Heliangelus exortis]|uniref:small integral membrane protein 20 isoform X1 n=1 Tax=Heliangelus exortis TaxID=472823 RepID=UPI003A948F1F
MAPRGGPEPRPGVRGSPRTPTRGCASPSLQPAARTGTTEPRRAAAGMPGTLPRGVPHLAAGALAAATIFQRAGAGGRERTVHKQSWYCSRGYSASRPKSVV